MWVYEGVRGCEGVRGYVGVIEIVLVCVCVYMPVAVCAVCNPLRKRLTPTTTYTTYNTHTTHSPHASHPHQHPFKGIRAYKLEELERRLMSDVAAEAQVWDGKILLHKESRASQDGSVSGGHVHNGRCLSCFGGGWWLWLVL